MAIFPWKTEFTPQGISDASDPGLDPGEEAPRVGWGPNGLCPWGGEGMALPVQETKPFPRTPETRPKPPAVQSRNLGMVDLLAQLAEALLQRLFKELSLLHVQFERHGTPPGGRIVTPPTAQDSPSLLPMAPLFLM